MFIGVCVYFDQESFRGLRRGYITSTCMYKAGPSFADIGRL